MHGRRFLVASAAQSDAFAASETAQILIGVAKMGYRPDQEMPQLQTYKSCIKAAGAMQAVGLHGCSISVCVGTSSAGAFSQLHRLALSRNSGRPVYASCAARSIAYMLFRRARLLAPFAYSALVFMGRYDSASMPPILTAAFRCRLQSCQLPCTSTTTLFLQLCSMPAVLAAAVHRRLLPPAPLHEHRYHCLRVRLLCCARPTHAPHFTQAPATPPGAQAA
eukprot:1157103-Pelagomonas_calceolata.AAC.2